MKHFFWFIIGCLFVAIGWLFFQWYYPVQRNSGMITDVTIASGEGLHEVGRDLYNDALIHNLWWFEAYVRLRGWDKRFQIGEFKIDPAMSAARIAAILTGHEGQTERIVTIIEGWKLSDIERIMQGQSLDSSLQGYLFPDTYRLSNYVVNPTLQLVEKAQANFNRQVTPELRAEIKKQGRTLPEVITMASILEAEVRGATDRALVADLLLRRLKIGMPLQVDSALETYKERGLPLGPINNPGLSAIRAAIYPQANQFWYFLTAQDGHVVYAKTFADHVKNKQWWLKQ